jgi:transposase InsO family protein
LYLAVENIDHSRTRAKSPQTNGICERFHRTIQEEFYGVAFRKELYNSLEELQFDLDTWVRQYNEERAHSGNGELLKLGIDVGENGSMSIKSP